jgi:hypothetical protein
MVVFIKFIWLSRLNKSLVSLNIGIEAAIFNLPGWEMHMTNGKPTPPKSAGRRPPHIKAPTHLSENPPIPTPDSLEKATKSKENNDPTRYGDWVRKGIAVDF